MTMCKSTKEFLKANTDHNVVKQIMEANDKRDRPLFTTLLKEIKAHLYAVCAILELKECNCIDCFSEIEKLENDLIAGMK
jgi:hypothetical protein